MQFLPALCFFTVTIIASHVSVRGMTLEHFSDKKPGEGRIDDDDSLRPASEQEKVLLFQEEGNSVAEGGNGKPQSHGEESENINLLMTDGGPKMIESAEFNTTNAFAQTVDLLTYIDKSMFCEEFMNMHRQVYLTAPPRFGKTTILYMVRAFAEITMDDNGACMPVENYNVFSKMPHTSEEELAILDNKMKHFWNVEFAVHPVVYLDFDEISVESEKALLESIDAMMRSALHQHRHLFHEDLIYNDKKQEMKDFLLTGKKPEKSFRVDDWMHYLFLLLFRRFNKRGAILIDNLDAPVRKIIFSSENLPVEKLLATYGDFVGQVIKADTNIDFSLLTGTMQLDGVLNFPWAPRNFTHIPVFSHKDLAKYYGFTEDDVIHLVKHLSKKPEEITDINEWYNGYFVKDSDMKLFNFQSINEYFNNKVFQSYWIKSEYLHKKTPLFDFDNVGAQTWETVQGHALKCDPDQKIGEAEVKQLKDLIGNSKAGKKLDSKGKSLVLQFLADEGYFTRYFDNNGDSFYLAPNREIRTELGKAVWRATSSKYQVSGEVAKKYSESLFDLSSFDKSKCEAYVKNTANLWKHFKDAGSEAAFAAALFGAALSDDKNTWLEVRDILVPTATMTDEKTDCVLLRENIAVAGKRTYTGCMIELKSGPKSSSNDALKLILDKNYVENFDTGHPRLRGRNVTSFILIGLHEEKDKLSASILFNSLDIKSAIKVTSSR